MTEKKTVYVPMSVDFVHIGHIKILDTAKELGHVIVGLLTDEATAQYKRTPLTKFEDRKKIIESMSQVDEVVAQLSKDYLPNLVKLKPDFFVHGDDWKTGPLRELRKQVIQTMAQWGGKVVEPSYTKGLSSSDIAEHYSELGTTPQARMRRLRRCMETKPITRLIETHNGLTGLIAEKTVVRHDGEYREFDAMWISSLTDSTAKGKPDTGAVDVSSRLQTIQEILDVTTKPVIVDGDNGGLTEHFIFTVRTLERLGVSAIIIEDKTGLKKNSLFGTDVPQTQDSIEKFCEKINAGKRAQVTNDFMIIARIESLILKKGVDDALTRARAYIDAGADAIMIHSKEDHPEEIIEFCTEYNTWPTKVPLVAVPSTYNQITEDVLSDHGIHVVIYANHLLRSAYPAMKRTAETILKNKRSYEATEYCMPIKDILTLIPGGK